MYRDHVLGTELSQMSCPVNVPVKSKYDYDKCCFYLFKINSITKFTNLPPSCTQLMSKTIILQQANHAEMCVCVNMVKCELYNPYDL